MHRKLVLSIASLVPLALAGCPTRDISKIDPSPAIEARQNIPVSTVRNVDILFVIDNSHSMKEEQDSLSRNFVTFINVLNTIEGGLPNMHIGVVSSDLGIGGWSSDQCDGAGDDGLLQNAPRITGCKPPDGVYISDVAIAGGQRDRNYTGSLADAFSCIANLGITGCGVEQHLESMKLALDGSRTLNAGFLRNDAYLAVIILADEDDCSANRPDIIFNPSQELDHLNSEFGPFNSFRCTEFGITCNGQTLSRTAADYQNCVPRKDSYIEDPIKYYNFLRTLKGNPNLLIGAVIAGNPTPVSVGLTERNAPNLKPSCQSANGVADPAVRLSAFAQQFGNNGTFVPICQDDLSEPVKRVAELLKKVIGTSCLQGNIDATDIDAATAGTQIECHVADVRFAGQSGEIEKSIPRCRMLGANSPDTSGLSSDKPCWWVTENTDKCKLASEPTHLELKIERGGQDAPIGTDVVVRCLLAE